MLILEVITKAATKTIESYERELITLFSAWNRQLIDAIEEDEPYTVLLPQATKRSNWVRDNLPYLQAVANRSKHKKHAKEISNLTYSAKKDSKQSAGKLFVIICEILAKGNETLSKLLKEYTLLTSEAHKLAMDIRTGAYDYRERGGAPNISKEKDKSLGVQNSQVEQLINDVLKGLPKEKAAQFRQVISRSDNKLKTLQDLMK